MNKALTLAIAAGLSACASVGDKGPSPTELRLQALEQENASLKNQLTEQGRMISGMSAVGLGSSVANLEEQMRNMRGQLEQLGYQSQQQEERQRALYVDLDQRLARLETGKSPLPATGAAAAEPDEDADQAAYLAAFQKLKASDYAAAVSGFEEFLSKYAASPYAPNAQYWIGEAHYVQRSFDQAWDAFSKVLSRYPKSNKAPDSLLKQGLLRVEQGRLDDARALLEKLSQEHPTTTAGRLAKERLQQMGE